MNNMEELALRFTHAAAHVLWVVALLWLVVFLIDRLWLRSPAARHGIYLLGMLTMLAAFPLCFLLVGSSGEKQITPDKAVSEKVVKTSTLEIPVVEEVTPLTVREEDTSSIPAVAPTAAQEVSQPIPSGEIGEIGVTPPGANANDQERSASALLVVGPWVSGAYLLGLLLMLLRLALGWSGSARLRKRADLITSGPWHDALSSIRQRIRARGQVTVAWSREVAAPVVMGFVKPAILLPISLASRLSPVQVEAVLAHELAHLARRDTWAVLVQRVAETVLFFHPAVWWMSRRMEEAREEACDDLVLSAGCNPADYAEALVVCSECRLEQSGLSAKFAEQLAATGTKGQSLRLRVMRLLGQGENGQIKLGHAGWLLGLFATAGVAMAMVLGNMDLRDERKALDESETESLQHSISAFREDWDSTRATRKNHVEGQQAYCIIDNDRKVIEIIRNGVGVPTLTLVDLPSGYDYMTEYWALQGRVFKYQRPLELPVVLRLPDPGSPHVHESVKLVGKHPEDTFAIELTPSGWGFGSSPGNRDGYEYPYENKPAAKSMLVQGAEREQIIIQWRENKLPLLTVKQKEQVEQWGREYVSGNLSEEDFLKRVEDLGPAVVPDMLEMMKVSRASILASKGIKLFAHDPRALNCVVSRLEELAETDQESSLGEKAGCLQLLGEMGGPEHADLAARFIRVELQRTIIEMSAVRVLGKLGGEKAMNHLMTAFDRFPTREWFVIVQQIAAIGDSAAVPELKRRMEMVELPPSERFPNVTVPTFLKAINKLSSGDRDPIPTTTSWFHGCSYKFPYAEKHKASSFSVNPPRDHLLQDLPDVDPATESGRKAIWDAIESKTDGPGFTIDGDELVLLNGLKAMPLWEKEPPYPVLMYDWLRTTSQARLRDQLEARESSRRVPIPNHGVMLAMGQKGLLYGLHLKRLKEHRYAVTISPQDPLRLLVRNEGSKTPFIEWRTAKLQDRGAKARNGALNISHPRMVQLTEELIREPGKDAILSAEFVGSNVGLGIPGAEEFVLVEAKSNTTASDLVQKLALARVEDPEIPNHQKIVKGTVLGHAFEKLTLGQCFGFAVKMPGGFPIAGLIEISKVDNEAQVIHIRHSFLLTTYAKTVFASPAGGDEKAQAPKLPDGIYRVRPQGSKQKGVEVPRSDADGTKVLLHRLSDHFGDVTMSSASNDNTKFQIELKSAGPFKKGDDIGHMALVVNGHCTGIWGHSDPDAEMKMNLSSWVVGKEASAKMAKGLGVKPRFRIHPGHKMRVKFSPTKPSFLPGEPVILNMVIKNVGERPFSFVDGGRQRGARNNQFGFRAFRNGGDGAEVPDTGDPTHFGGPSGLRTLKRGEVFEKKVDITKWFDLTKPDTYKIEARYDTEIYLKSEYSHLCDWEDVAKATTKVVISKNKEDAEVKPAPKEFHGFLLDPKRKVVGGYAAVPSLYIEKPRNSRSYELRDNVKVVYMDLDGDVYYRPDKSDFFIQNALPGATKHIFHGPYEGNPVKQMKLPEKGMTEFGKTIRTLNRRHLRDEHKEDAGIPGRGMIAGQIVNRDCMISIRHEAWKPGEGGDLIRPSMYVPKGEHFMFTNVPAGRYEVTVELLMNIHGRIPDKLPKRTKLIKWIEAVDQKTTKLVVRQEEFYNPDKGDTDPVTSEAGSEDLTEQNIRDACASHLQNLPPSHRLSTLAKSIDHTRLRLIHSIIAEDEALAFLAVGDQEQVAPGTSNNHILWDCRLQKKGGKWSVVQLSQISTAEQYQITLTEYHKKHPHAPSGGQRLPKPVAQSLLKTVHVDYRKLLGRWELVRLSSTGGGFNLHGIGPDSKPGAIFTFATLMTPVGTLESNDKQIVKPALPFAGLTTLKPRANPKQIRFSSSGRSIMLIHPGIYRFEPNGDLTICLNVNDSEAPKTFELSDKKRQMLIQLRKIAKGSSEPGGPQFDWDAKAKNIVDMIIQKEMGGSISPGGIGYSLNSELVMPDKIEAWLTSKLKEIPDLSLRIRLGVGVQPQHILVARQAARLAGIPPKRIKVMNPHAIRAPKEPVEVRLEAVGEQGEVSITVKPKLGGMLWWKGWDGERVRINGVEYRRKPAKDSGWYTGLPKLHLYDVLGTSWTTMEGEPAPEWNVGEYRVRLGLGFIRGGADNSNVQRVWSDEIVVKVKKPSEKQPKKISSDKEGALDFLKGIREFKGMNLKMSENRFLELVASHGLLVEISRENQMRSYWVMTRSGENIIVGFNGNKCGGIQRMRPSPKMAKEKYAQRDADRKQTYELYRAASKLFNEGGDANKAIILFHEAGQTAPFGLEAGKRAKDLASQLVKMAKEPKPKENPETVDGRLDTLIWDLRNARGQAVEVPGKARLLGPLANAANRKLGSQFLKFAQAPETRKATIKQLITMLSDPRPTRLWAGSLNGGHFLRNGDVALEILSKIAGKSFDDRSNRDAYLWTAPPELRREIIQRVQKWRDSVEEQGGLKPGLAASGRRAGAVLEAKKQIEKELQVVQSALMQLQKARTVQHRDVQEMRLKIQQLEEDLVRLENQAKAEDMDK